MIAALRLCAAACSTVIHNLVWHVGHLAEGDEQVLTSRKAVVEGSLQEDVLSPAEPGPPKRRMHGCHVINA
jgi:hypothetical protein